MNFIHYQKKNRQKLWIGILEDNMDRRTFIVVMTAIISEAAMFIISYIL